MRTAGEIVVINGQAMIYTLRRPEKKASVIDNGLVKEIREEDVEFLVEPEDDLDAARGVILGVGIGLVFWLVVLSYVLS